MKKYLIMQYLKWCLLYCVTLSVLALRTSVILQLLSFLNIDNEVFLRNLITIVRRDGVGIIVTIMIEEALRLSNFPIHG